MKVDYKVVVVACAITAGAVYYVSARQAEQENDRPVLRLLVRAAKLMLWAAMFAEQPPQEETSIQQTVGADGYPTISHARSL
jgi:hypothetical protein